MADYKYYAPVMRELRSRGSPAWLYVWAYSNPASTLPGLHEDYRRASFLSFTPIYGKLAEAYHGYELAYLFGHSISVLHNMQWKLSKAEFALAKRYRDHIVQFVATG